jgi:predicted RNase H-like nuclease
VEQGVTVASGRVASDREILDWLQPYTDGDVVVAIDAPLVVLNLTGRRPCEREISRCFGAHHAAAHSSNLGLPAFRAGVRGGRIARELGLSIDPSFEPGSAVRRAIEVYPHPAIVALFALPLTLKYKAKSGRATAGRCAAFAQLLAHLEGLADASPPLDVTASPRWRDLRLAVAEPATGAALDRAEDEIDAYVCAYVAEYYWTHGLARCRVVGDLDSGYIVTPVTPAQGACLDRFASA